MGGDGTFGAGGGGKDGTPVGVMHVRAHAPRPPMVNDATSTGSLAQAFLKKAASPGGMGGKGHPCRGCSR